MTTSRTLKLIVDLSGNAQEGLTRISGTIGKVGALAGGAALGGITAIAGGLVGASVAGLSMNNSLEQATARINAFTKDGTKTADILRMITDRAAKTPFEFQAMATAAAALLPSAKQAQVGIEDLIEQAEILAASNPAEGLEGAAFALKEAVSGDFTSIIERFNLPRSYINKLKEEGVPALEIVQRAMKELGLDTDLVSAMANTAQGRWSTFKDTIQSLAAQVTQPIFDRFSAGLGSLNDKLSASQPQLQAVATALAKGVNAGLDWLAELLPKIIAEFNSWSGTLDGTVRPAMILIEDALTRIAAALGINTEKVSAQDVIVKAFSLTLRAITTAIQLAAITAQVMASAVEKVSQAITIARGLFDQLRTIVNLSMEQMRNNTRGWADTADSAFSRVRSGIDGVKSVISGLISRFNSMRRAAIDALNAMSSLVPHSPVIYEKGLMQINDAAQQVKRSFDDLRFNKTNLGGLGINPGPTGLGINPAPLAAVGAGAAGGQIIVNLTYAPVISTADRLEAEQVLAPFIAEGVRKNLAGKR